MEYAGDYAIVHFCNEINTEEIASLLSKFVDSMTHIKLLTV
jgi:hypothetical protein